MTAHYSLHIILTLDISICINYSPLSLLYCRWILQHRALQELDEKHCWFRPMMNAISLKLIGDVSWGLKFRVVLGATLSTLDLITDIYITYCFWKDGRETFFKSTLAMLAASISLMIWVVITQNRKMGIGKILLEVLTVIFGLKPAVDAYRVASASSILEGQLLDPLIEMTIIKCIEMFAEAIPGVIIQLSAILSSEGGVSNAALASLAISSLTTGFISATTSYDWDTDPTKRVDNPEFFGYIPNNATKRAIIFISMLLLSAVMLNVRALTLVVLGLVSKNAAFLYVCVELGLYLFTKIVRGDFYYWLPLEGVLEIIISLVSRIMVKIVVDFTNIAQFRHPNEVGGIYWIFGFTFSLTSLPLAVSYYENNGGGGNISDVVRIAWSSTLLLLICAIFLVLTFFTFMDKKYRHTFYNLKRGKDVTLEHMDSSEDCVKALVFIKNRRHWESIESKVEEWVRENWKRWMEEEPDWLTDNMKARIPQHMIPGNEKIRKIKHLARKRGRSSIKGRRRPSASGAHKVAPKRDVATKVNEEKEEEDTVRRLF